MIQLLIAIEQLTPPPVPIPPPPGLPIDSNIYYLMAVAIGYGIYKMIGVRKNQSINQEGEGEFNSEK